MAIKTYIVGIRGSAKAQLSILGKINDKIWYLWQFFAILASFGLFVAALGRYQIVWNEDEDAKYQCLVKNVVGTRGSAKAQLSILGKINDNL